MESLILCSNQTQKFVTRLRLIEDQKKISSISVSLRLERKYVNKH